MPSFFWDNLRYSNAMLNIFDNVVKRFSRGIGIDLGTSNSLVYLEGEGVIMREPTIIAVNKKTQRIVAIGKEAKIMLGKTPPHIEVVRPLKDGVIWNFEIAEELVGYYVQEAVKRIKSFFYVTPRVIVGAPVSITSVQNQALMDVLLHTGAKYGYIVPEPFAAAVGMEINVLESFGICVVDIGGGTTDIALISLGGIVLGKSIPTAGDELTRLIQETLRLNFQLYVGDSTAEEIKIKIASIVENDESMCIARGRDIVSGLPREISLSSQDIYPCVYTVVEKILTSLSDVLSDAPPELAQDILNGGIILAGGGAYLRGLKEVIESEMGVRVHVDNNPLETVIKGIGIMIENFDAYEPIMKNFYGTFDAQ